MEIIGNRELTYLYAGGMPFAIHQKEGENEQLYYLHLDYQGSIRAITNEQGTVVEERDYDACSMGFRFLQAACAVRTIAPSIPKKRSELREGRPRDPNTLEYTANNPFSVSTITNRGYTFHVRETWLFAKSPSRTIPLCGKHIYEFSLINMNARMYDPILRRVISPYNYIQAPDYTQSFNRYSYCWNNPLKYTDPDGDIVVAALIYAVFFTDAGYEAQKYVSPVAVKFNLAVGSEGFHAGAETSIGIPKAAPLSYRWHWGSTYYSGAYDGGVSGHVSKNGKEITYLGVFSLSSTQYHSKGSDGTSTSQTVGRVMIGGPGFNVKYENDWHPEWMDKMAIGFDLNDGGDRYRSAALQVNVGPFKAGFNLFTGDPGLNDDDRIADLGTGIHEGKFVYTSGNSNQYRSGIAYFGFGPFRYGVNSEGVRHQIQNRFAHDFIQKGRAAHFQVMDRSPRPYWYIGSGYGSGLW
jgi:RHS repeat-associated protein